MSDAKVSAVCSIVHNKLLSINVKHSPYLLEGARRPLGEAALHQVVSQLPEVKQLVSVFLN